MGMILSRDFDTVFIVCIIPIMGMILIGYRLSLVFLEYNPYYGDDSHELLDLSTLYWYNPYYGDDSEWAVPVHIQDLYNPYYGDDSAVEE